MNFVSVGSSADSKFLQVWKIKLSIGSFMKIKCDNPYFSETVWLLLAKYTQRNKTFDIPCKV